MLLVWIGLSARWFYSNDHVDIALDEAMAQTTRKTPKEAAFR